LARIAPLGPEEKEERGLRRGGMGAQGRRVVREYVGT
jgi:hypothetical protein